MDSVITVGYWTMTRRKIPGFSNLPLFDEKPHGSGFNDGGLLLGSRDGDESLVVGSRVWNFADAMILCYLELCNTTMFGSAHRGYDSSDALQGAELGYHLAMSASSTIRGIRLEGA